MAKLIVLLCLVLNFSLFQAKSLHTNENVENTTNFVNTFLSPPSNKLGIFRMYDYLTHTIAYKDLITKYCYLERMQGQAFWESTSRVLLVSARKLTRGEILKLGGQRIAQFCFGWPTLLLQQPVYNNILINTINRKRRSNSHYFVGRNGRGQSQSQYLNFGSTKEPGTAEAESNNGGTKAVVSGSSGMGQAQSQSNPFNCEDCYGGNGRQYSAQKTDFYAPDGTNGNVPISGEQILGPGQISQGFQPGAGARPGDDLYRKPDINRAGATSSIPRPSVIQTPTPAQIPSAQYERDWTPSGVQTEIPGQGRTSEQDYRPSSQIGIPSGTNGNVPISGDQILGPGQISQGFQPGAGARPGDGLYRTPDKNGAGATSSIPRPSVIQTLTPAQIPSAQYEPNWTPSGVQTEIPGQGRISEQDYRPSSQIGIPSGSGASGVPSTGQREVPGQYRPGTYLPQIHGGPSRIGQQIPEILQFKPSQPGGGQGIRQPGIEQPHTSESGQFTRPESNGNKPTSSQYLPGAAQGPASTYRPIPEKQVSDGYIQPGYSSQGPTFESRQPGHTGISPAQVGEPSQIPTYQQQGSRYTPGHPGFIDQRPGELGTGTHIPSYKPQGSSYIPGLPDTTIQTPGKLGTSSQQPSYQQGIGQPGTTQVTQPEGGYQGSTNIPGYTSHTGQAPDSRYESQGIPGQSSLYRPGGTLQRPSTISETPTIHYPGSSDDQRVQSGSRPSQLPAGPQRSVQSHDGSFSGQISGNYQSNKGHAGEFSGVFNGKYNGRDYIGRNQLGQIDEQYETGSTGQTGIPVINQGYVPIHSGGSTSTIRQPGGIGYTGHTQQQPTQSFGSQQYGKSNGQGAEQPGQLGYNQAGQRSNQYGTNVDNQQIYKQPVSAITSGTEEAIGYNQVGRPGYSQVGQPGLNIAAQRQDTGQYDLNQGGPSGYGQSVGYTGGRQPATYGQPGGVSSQGQNEYLQPESQLGQGAGQTSGLDNRQSFGLGHRSDLTGQISPSTYETGQTNIPGYETGRSNITPQQQGQGIRQPTGFEGRQSGGQDHGSHLTGEVSPPRYGTGQTNLPGYETGRSNGTPQQQGQGVRQPSGFEGRQSGGQDHGSDLTGEVSSSRYGTGQTNLPGYETGGSNIPPQQQGQGTGQPPGFGNRQTGYSPEQISQTPSRKPGQDQSRYESDQTGYVEPIGGRSQQGYGYDKPGYIAGPGRQGQYRPAQIGQPQYGTEQNGVQGQGRQTGQQLGLSTGQAPGYQTGQSPGLQPGQYGYSQGRVPTETGYGNVPGNYIQPGQSNYVSGQTGGPGSDSTLSQLPGITDDSDSQAQTSIQQISNGTQASASSQGKYQGGTAQSQVSGTYSGAGSFSASAGSNDGKRGAQTQITGNKEGSISSAQGNGGKGQSQAQVQLSADTGDTQSSAQSGGINHNTNTQVQAGGKGGMADAQANGPGATSSQAQIGFTPHNENEPDEQSVPFGGGGTASAQSGTYAGQSQSQIQGKYKYGIRYTGNSQASSGNDGNVQKRIPLPTMKPFSFSTQRSILPKVNTNERHSSEGEQPIIDETRQQNQDVTNTRDKPKQPQTRSTTIENVTEIEDAKILKIVTISTTPAPTNDEDYSGEYDEYEEHEDKLEEHARTQRQHIILGPLENLEASNSRTTAPLLKHGDIINSGQQIPGTPGYQIPVGFRGRVASGQTTTGFRSYDKPIYATGANTKLKNGGVGYGSGYTYQPVQYPVNIGKPYPKFVSVSKSETGSKNLQTGKKTPSVYYTQSSSCGYFTNTCFYSNGQKICMPKPRINPDGSRIRC